MNHSWPNNEWSGVSCPPPYDRHVPVNTDVIRETAQRVQELPEANIREIIERIPAEYVSDPDQSKRKLVTGLLDRQRRITEILRTRHAI